MHDGPDTPCSPLSLVSEVTMYDVHTTCRYVLPSVFVVYPDIFPILLSSFLHLTQNPSFTSGVVEAELGARACMRSLCILEVDNP